MPSAYARGAAARLSAMFTLAAPKRMARSWAIGIAACVALSALSSQAATTPNSIVTPQTPNRGILQFTSSSTAGTYATLYTAGSNGSKCYAVVSSNTDSTTHLLTVGLFNSSTQYSQVSVTSTANAGNANGTAPQNLLSTTIWSNGGLPQDSEGNYYLLLASGDTLEATFATSISSGKVVNLYAECVDF
jgi:hypothetical protein